ncbi:hypothetical protein VTH06DRAFT_3197 [Thermothelomyces fergusii]
MQSLNPSKHRATTVTAEERRFRWNYIRHLDDVLQRIEDFGDSVYILNDDQLASLKIRKAEPLDIEEQSVDMDSRFFSPRFSLEEARNRTDGFIAYHGKDLEEMCNWPKRCRRGSYVGLGEPTPSHHDPEERHPLCYPLADAETRLGWFLEIMGVTTILPPDTGNKGIWEGSEWSFVFARHLRPNPTSGRACLPMHDSFGPRIGNPPYHYAYHVNGLFWITDPSADLPHIGGTVCDSAEPREGEVLRSEVVAAIALLRLQFRITDIRRHRILPSIVFSFHHDRTGRVTQFRFDGRSLVLRQSRLLDFRSDQPTTDAYHMIRWIANRPMGETKILRPVAEGMAGPEEDREGEDWLVW